MVKGLDLFKQAFAEHANQYFLIGGTASSIVMGEAGLSFRATKDLDMVLHVEVLDAAFGRRFWQFIQDGQYAVKEESASRKRQCFRFQKPADPNYPVMIELFSRKPDLEWPIEPGTLTPIPFDEDISSLSAILLDDEYYGFLLEGRDEIDGLPLIRHDRLIPLKAIAWLELSERKQAGAQIDSKHVRKHLYDVMRLSQLLVADGRIAVPKKISGDMRRFIAAATVEPDVDPTRAEIRNTSAAEIFGRIAIAYGVE